MIWNRNRRAIQNAQADASWAVQASTEALKLSTRAAEVCDEALEHSKKTLNLMLALALLVFVLGIAIEKLLAKNGT